MALLVLLALATPSAAARASEAASAPRGVSRPRLAVDYLPALVYENELVPVRLRVVNPGGSAVECTVTLSLHAGSDETNPAASPGRVRLTVPAARDRAVSFDVPPVGWATASVEFSPAEGGTESFWIARFGEGEDIPRLVARGECLYVAESGDVAVLSLEQRTSQPDRQWYLWKRLAERLSEGALPARVMILGAGLSDRQPGARGDYLAEVAARAAVPVAVVPLPGETDRRAFAPVLADLVTALAAFERERPAELVVWVVACDDARRATPLWTFRKAADFLLCRARAWGAGRLVVMFVPEPGVLPARRSLYAEQLRLAAASYRWSFVRVDELARPRYWAAPSLAGPQDALGRYPNREGHACLARAVLKRIGP